MLAHPKLHFWQLIKINVFLVIEFFLCLIPDIFTNHSLVEALLL